MPKTINPVNIISEVDKGRIALWLDSADLDWLAHHCCCSDNASQEQKERCLRLRFRANTALHKSQSDEGGSNVI